MLWTLAAWQRHGPRGRPPATLFEDRSAEDTPPCLPAEDPLDRLRREFAVLGFLCDRHPITLYDALRRSRKTVKARDLERRTGRRVRFAGWLVTGKVVHTKQGDPMEFLTFEDETGLIETTFFPAVYRRFCHLLDGGRPYLLAGRVETDWGATTLTVDHLEPLAPLSVFDGVSGPEGLRANAERPKLACQAGGEPIRPRGDDPQPAIVKRGSYRCENDSKPCG